jgi:hypothetical protein
MTSRLTITILCIIFAQIIHAQSNFATFHTDTSIFIRYKNNPDLINDLKKTEWLIKGDTLRFGNDSVIVKVDNEIDTIYFRTAQKHIWDTIICNINTVDQYTFVFNECCNLFNVQSKKLGRYLNTKLFFQNTDYNDKKTYLATTEFDGVFINNEKKELRHYCRSALFPNIYKIKIYEYEPCLQDDEECNNIFCIFENEDDEPTYEYEFSVKNILFNFLYMPLTETPVVIQIHSGTGKITLK